MRGCSLEGSRNATNYVHNAYRCACEQSDLLSTPGRTMLLCMQGTLHSHEPTKVRSRKVTTGVPTAQGQPVATGALLQEEESGPMT